MFLLQLSGERHWGVGRYQLTRATHEESGSGESVADQSQHVACLTWLPRVTGHGLGRGWGRGWDGMTQLVDCSMVISARL